MQKGLLLPGKAAEVQRISILLFLKLHPMAISATTYLPCDSLLIMLQIGPYMPQAATSYCKT